MDIPLPSDKLSIPPDSSTTAIKDALVVLVALGSFNPPTYMHLRMFELAKDALSSEGFSVIGGYMSPVNDAYKKPRLAPAPDRIKLCSLAVETSEFVMVDPWEASQATFQHSLLVLSRIKRSLNEDGMVGGGRGRAVKVMLVCGSDLLQSFGTPGVWNRGHVECICAEFGVVCIPRDGHDVDEIIANDFLLSENKRNIRVVHEPVLNQISSSKVRDCISKGMSVKYLMPDQVISYVREHRLYS